MDKRRFHFDSFFSHKGFQFLGCFQEGCLCRRRPRRCNFAGVASIGSWSRGNGSLMILGTGAGVKMIVDFVIAVGLGEGTRSILGAGLKRGYQPHLQHGSLIQQARQMSLPSCWGPGIVVAWCRVGTGTFWECDPLHPLMPTSHYSWEKRYLVVKRAVEHPGWCRLDQLMWSALAVVAAAMNYILLWLHLVPLCRRRTWQRSLRMVIENCSCSLSWWKEMIGSADIVHRCRHGEQRQLQLQGAVKSW